MKRILGIMLALLFVLAMAAACGTKDNSQEGQKETVVGTYVSERAGTLTFLENGKVMVAFTPDFAYLLEEHPNDTEYNYDFFVQRTPVPMQDATSFYIWYGRIGEDENHIEFECWPEGGTLRIKSYWPNDSEEITYVKQ